MLYLEQENWGEIGRKEAMCTYLKCLESGEARMGKKSLAG